MPGDGPIGDPAVVDIELTSRCNASCSFCPRDATPHQGLIDEATFTAALERVVEYRDALVEFQTTHPGGLDLPDDTLFVSFCGMGDPLIHPRAAEYVRRAAEAGLKPVINTNAALLSPETAERLLDAGLTMACLNVGEVDEAYEAVYGLPFERTRRNVEHFLAAAAGRCIAAIVVVDHRNDPDHVELVQDYWTRRGAKAFMHFGLVNRAGALFDPEQAEAIRRYRPEASRLLREAGVAPRCWIPFRFPFIGYDGTYYLCSSDWRKEVDLGSVFERSLVDIFEDKAEQVCGRSPICRDCTHEPTNALALSLARQAQARGDGARPVPDVAPDALLANVQRSAERVALMRAHLPSTVRDGGAAPRRRRIPLRS